MKTLYVTDLDGTLLTSEKKISEYTKQTINKLIEEGMCFAYATARSLSTASKVVDGIHFKTPIVAYNGVNIFDPQTGERIASQGFSPEETMWIKGVMERYHLNPFVYSFVDGKEYVSWVKGTETKGSSVYIADRKEDKRMHPLESEEHLYEGEVFYFSCIGPKEYYEEAYQEFLKDDRFTCMLQAEPYDKDVYWLEVLPRKATKANAILKLKEILGCDRIVSFGDGINDIPMFRISDECYAMENAVEQIKEIATGVIGNNNEDGVAKWLINNVR